MIASVLGCDPEEDIDGDEKESIADFALLAFQVFAGGRTVVAVCSTPKISGDGGLYQGRGRRRRMNPSQTGKRASPISAVTYQPTLLLGSQAHVAI